MLVSEVSTDGTLPILPTYHGPESFIAHLFDDAYLQFAVCDLTTSDVVGLVKSYGPNWRDSTVRVAVAMSANLRHTGLGLACIGRLIDIVISEGAFRKVYFEATATSVKQYLGVLERIFTVEGTLRKHQWVGDRFEDVLVCGLFAEEWLSARERYAPHIDRIVA